MQVKGDTMSKDIYKMAEELKIDKEGLELGMKEQPEKMKKMITQAYNFMNKGKKK